MEVEPRVRVLMGMVFPENCSSFCGDGNGRCVILLKERRLTDKKGTLLSCATWPRETECYNRTSVRSRKRRRSERNVVPHVLQRAKWTNFLPRVVTNVPWVTCGLDGRQPPYLLTPSPLPNSDLSPFSKFGCNQQPHIRSSIIIVRADERQLSLVRPLVFPRLLQSRKKRQFFLLSNLWA